MNRKRNEMIVFQQFMLVPEKLMEEVQQVDAQPNPYERWEKVKRALRVYRLSLMCGQSAVAGVPSSVIVGIPADCITYLPIKDWFYELVVKHNLPFSSGEWYLGEFETRMSKSVLSDENYRAFIKLKADEQWFNEHHGKHVGLVGGRFVVTGDEEFVLHYLQLNHTGQEGLIMQVLTEEEEDERAIHIG